MYFGQKKGIEHSYRNSLWRVFFDLCGIWSAVCTAGIFSTIAIDRQDNDGESGGNLEDRLSEPNLYSP
jgi:hypothetical protein